MYLSKICLLILTTNANAHSNYDNTILTLGSHISRFIGPRIERSLTIYDSSKENNNNQIMFIGKTSEQESFTDIVDNKMHLSYNYNVIPYNSNNTAQHIMCLIATIAKSDNTCTYDREDDLKIVHLPKITLVTHEFHVNRFKRTFNFIKYLFKNNYNIYIKNTPMQTELIKTPVNEDWLNKLEDEFMKNISTDIENAEESECFNDILKSLEYSA
tara:strand:+ start:1548 stop:2189 length:642 start_codon:yes stop_codon:yes gene_type:complete